VRRVYTDGACRGNPGPGGWAWASSKEHFGSGAEAHTTNQRMEIKAVIEALKACADDPIEIVSDSTYVTKCFLDRWHEGWLRRGWKNTQGQPVANRDLWEELFALVLTGGRTVTFTWVKGHSGDKGNDFVDLLATTAADNQYGQTSS
jgi:ribonuclease HI